MTKAVLVDGERGVPLAILGIRDGVFGRYNELIMPVEEPALSPFYAEISPTVDASSLVVHHLTLARAGTTLPGGARLEVVIVTGKYALERLRLAYGGSAENTGQIDKEIANKGLAGGRLRAQIERMLT